ncbi:NACHT domain-containing protein [Deinococcus oregonensis]|uniref:NACHT domain-containing protein n=1 Tax=Deinococcus oregonensis TaxID=1805970 RepID=A0ABV6ATR3_9DEIO
MATLELRVFGTPTVHLGGSPRAVPSRKAHALLITLALNGPTSRDTLAALLWNRSRDLALLNLRNAVHAARRALEPYAQVLQADRDVLTLDPAHTWVDAHQLRTADAHGLMVLRRGILLHGFRVPDSPAWDDQVQQWDQHFDRLYTQRAIELIDRNLRDGAAPLARTLATHLTQVHPLDEQAARLFLHTCEATGRPIEARAYHAEFRRRFLAEFGTLPTLPEPARLPTPSSTTDARVVPGPTLPRSLTSFIGREHERSDLLERLARPYGHLITLHGSPGVGKTRLALQVAQDALNTGIFEEAFFVPLDDLSDAASVPSRIMQVLQVPPNPQEEDLAVLTHALNGRHALLVLDNAESLLDGLPVLQRLLMACPRLALLVTSRERLHLKAEQVVNLSGLEMPLNTPLNDGKKTEAAWLFCERAQAVRQGFTLNEGNWAEVRRICELVGGSPLGLELAAAWVDTLPVEEIVRQLEEDLPHLSTPLRDVRPRHRSVESAISQSWRLLSGAQQEALMRLSVFEGGFTAPMAAQVAQVGEAGLEALIAKALLARQTPVRYGFHPMVREVVKLNLQQNQALLRDANGRHATYFLRALHALNRQASGAVSPALMAFLQGEEANLLVTLGCLREEKRYQDLGRLAEPLLWHFPLRSRFLDGLAFCEDLLGAFDDSPEGRAGRASYLIGYAWLTLFAGEVQRALTLGQEALELVNNSPDHLLRLRALDGYGQACCRAYRLEESRVSLAQAEEVARQLGDPTRLMRSLNTHALTLALLEQFGEAHRRNEEAYALYTTGQVTAGMDVIWLLSNMGVERLLRNELLEACGLVQEGLRMAQNLGASGQMPILLALHDLAQVEVLLQQEARVDAAALTRRVNETLDHTRGTGEKFGQALLLGVRGRLALREGTSEAGARDVLDGLSLAWATQNRMVVYWLLPYAPLAMAVAGDVRGAAGVHAFLEENVSVTEWDRHRAQREWGEARRLVPEDLGSARVPPDLEGVAAMVKRALALVTPPVQPNS